MQPSHLINTQIRIRKKSLQGKYMEIPRCQCIVYAAQILISTYFPDFRGKINSVKVALD